MDYAMSVEMVEWLHVNRREGCTTLAMDNAVARGDVEKLLRGERTEGCTIQAGVNAHDGEFIAIFEWLVETYPDIMQLDEIHDRVERITNLKSRLLTANDVKGQRTS